jgi:hypothetical protein
LEHDIKCFIHWLSAEEGKSEQKVISIEPKIFEKDNTILIHDYFQNIDIRVSVIMAFYYVLYVNHMNVLICLITNLYGTKSFFVSVMLQTRSIY